MSYSLKRERRGSTTGDTARSTLPPVRGFAPPRRTAGVVQRYTTADSFTATKVGKTPIFTTEAVEPELTYTSSLKSLFQNREYRLSYPVKKPDPRTADLLVADDGSLAIHDTEEHPKEFYAKGKVIDDSNAQLERVQSSFRLQAGGNSIEVSDQQLKMVTPENVSAPEEDDGSDFASMLQHLCYQMASEVIGMQGYTTSEVVLGGPGNERTVEISPDPVTDKKVQALTRAIARSEENLDVNTATQAMELKGEMSEQDAATYGRLLGGQQLGETAETLGINEYANPEVGEAFATFSNPADEASKLDYSEMSNEEPTNREGRVWGYHYGGVVAQSEDRQDKITLENYNRKDDAANKSVEVRDALLAKHRRQLGEDFDELRQLEGQELLVRLDDIAKPILDEYKAVMASAAPKRRWFFQIYGSQPDQSFHAKQAASGTFVNPLTVRVQKPFGHKRADTVKQVQAWHETIKAYIDTHRNGASSALEESGILDALASYKENVQGAESHADLQNAALGVNAPDFETLFDAVQKRYAQALESYIGADKSLFEMATDFSLRLELAQEIKDLEQLKSALLGVKNALRV